MVVVVVAGSNEEEEGVSVCFHQGEEGGRVEASTKEGGDVMLTNKVDDHYGVGSWKLAMGKMVGRLWTWRTWVIAWGSWMPFTRRRRRKEKEGQGRSPRDHLGLERSSLLSLANTHNKKLTVSLVSIFHSSSNQP